MKVRTFSDRAVRFEDPHGAVRAGVPHCRSAALDQVICGDWGLSLRAEKFLT
jgi:hypothetical protein